MRVASVLHRRDNCGLGPHLGALYYTLMVAAQLLDGDGWDELLATNDRLANLPIAAVFLFPGVFALLGGLIGVWTWWMFQPAKGAIDRQPTYQPRASGR